MTCKYTWKSKLGPCIRDFIALKRSNGFLYDAEEYQLHRFDDFCYNHEELNVTKITRAQMELWRLQFLNENTNTRNYRIDYIRVFSRYLNSLGIDSYIPSKGASTYKPKVYVPSVKELQIFFRYIDNNAVSNSSILHTRLNLNYPVLFRLFYCCGLRLSEACYLKRNLVNFDDETITILQSKGKKDRKIYLSHDLSIVFRRFDLKMDNLIPDRKWMFCGNEPIKPFQKTSIDGIFHKFWNAAFPDWQGKVPTPQALRHCFVINKVEQWMTEGKNINAMMPYLSKTLGHNSADETYYYYNNLKSVFPLIQKNDTHSNKIIPEVKNYEN